MPDLAVQATIVEPVDVVRRRGLDVVDTRPRAAVADQLGLIERVQRLSHRVVVAIALGVDGSDRVAFVEALRITDRSIRTTPVTVMDQAGVAVAGMLTTPDTHPQRVESEIPSHQRRS